MLVGDRAPSDIDLSDSLKPIPENRIELVRSPYDLMAVAAVVDIL
jgi:hypothetical protein